MKACNKGAAELLLRLIRKKLGTQAAEQYRQRVRQANLDALERWADNILGAETVDELFG